MREWEGGNAAAGAKDQDQVFQNWPWPPPQDISLPRYAYCVRHGLFQPARTAMHCVPWVCGNGPPSVGVDVSFGKTEVVQLHKPLALKKKLTCFEALILRTTPHLFLFEAHSFHVLLGSSLQQVYLLLSFLYFGPRIYDFFKLSQFRSSRLFYFSKSLFLPSSSFNLLRCLTSQI